MPVKKATPAKKLPFGTLITLRYPSDLKRRPKQEYDDNQNRYLFPALGPMSMQVTVGYQDGEWSIHAFNSFKGSKTVHRKSMAAAQNAIIDLRMWKGNR